MSPGARRGVLLAALALALVSGALLAARPVLAQASHLWFQHRISHAVLPPGTIIYTEDPTRIAALRGRKDYRGKRQTWDKDYPADAWERVHSDRAFSARHRQGGANDRFQVTDTFGYRRTSPGGIEWIVQLNQASGFSGGEAPPGKRFVLLTQSAFEPAGWVPGARGVCVSHLSSGILLGPSDHLTLFAPQPDGDDPSRISVPYELNAQPGELTATITDRGAVAFAVASGPAQLLERR